MQRMTDNKKSRGRPAKKEPTTRFEMRLDVSQKEAWEIDAAKEGVSLAAWMKQLGDKKSKYKTKG